MAEVQTLVATAPAPRARRLVARDVRELAFWFVERECGVNRAELLSHRIPEHLVRARALFVWIAKTFGPERLSYVRIGEWLDRDHTSIIHLYRNKGPRLLERDADWAKLCERFGARLHHLQETFDGITRH